MKHRYEDLGDPAYLQQHQITFYRAAKLRNEDIYSGDFPKELSAEDIAEFRKEEDRQARRVQLEVPDRDGNTHFDGESGKNGVLCIRCGAFMQIEDLRDGGHCSLCYLNEFG